MIENAIADAKAKQKAHPIGLKEVAAVAIAVYTCGAATGAALTTMENLTAEGTIKRGEKVPHTEVANSNRRHSARLGVMPTNRCCF
jgi:hypothetical protein